MRALGKAIYLTAGYNTVAFGSGRKEFNPKKPMPSFETYLKEAVTGSLAQVAHPEAIEEAVITNFMAARFLKQGNLAGFLPSLHPGLRYRPVTRVEGACGSGGMGLYTAIKTVAGGWAEAVLVVGFEVQNTVKAVYGADILAGAGYYSGERKGGHAFFFPGQFSDRAGAYMSKYGADPARKAMGAWYAQMVKNARKNPKAQEFHNTSADLEAQGQTPPNAKVFCEYLNFFDCSKVSDAACALVVASQEGLGRLGVSAGDKVPVAGIAQVEDDITLPPPDLASLETTRRAAAAALEMAGIGPTQLGVLEVHDCFSITGILALEAIGLAAPGQGSEFVLAGKTAPEGEIPTNATGGLIGYGHPTGATGVRQAVDLLHQFTGKAGDCQVRVPQERPYGMMVNMGGNDKTLTCLVVGPQR